MKSVLLGPATALSILGLTASASAADLAPRLHLKAASPIATTYDWSGFYLGGNGGWGSSRNCWTYTHSATNNVLFDTQNPRFDGCNNAPGGTAGGQIGYRWQSNALVVGVEAQGNWADLSGSNSALRFGPSFTNVSSTDAFGLFTGQVGYAWNNVLVSVKGGAAVARNLHETLFNGTKFDESRETRWGGTLGVSLDYGIAPNWSVGLAYDHLVMGSRPNAFVATAPTFDPTGFFTKQDRISQDIDLVTVRVNYRFSGPAIAKY